MGHGALIAQHRLRKGMEKCVNDMLICIRDA